MMSDRECKICDKPPSACPGCYVQLKRMKNMILKVILISGRMSVTQVSFQTKIPIVIVEMLLEQLVSDGSIRKISPEMNIYSNTTEMIYSC